MLAFFFERLFHPVQRVLDRFDEADRRFRLASLILDAADYYQLLAESECCLFKPPAQSIQLVTAQMRLHHFQPRLDVALRDVGVDRLLARSEFDDSLGIVDVASVVVIEPDFAWLRNDTAEVVSHF